MPWHLIFESSQFQMNWPEGKDIDTVEPWGRDCANYISTAISHEGAIATQAIQSIDGWMLDVIRDNQKFQIYVHWAPLGRPPRDHWVLQIKEKRGFLNSSNSSIEKRFCEFIESILSKNDDIRSLKLISNTEFGELY